jgi:hypothetical protein
VTKQDELATAVLKLRAPQSLKASIAALARRHDRSVAGEVRVALQAHLEQHDAAGRST